MPADKLVALLLSLYSADELHQLIRTRWPDAEIVGGAPRAVAQGVVAWLERRGLLAAELFGALRDQRPDRRADIDEVAGAWESRPTGGTPAPAAAVVGADHAPNPVFPYDICVTHADPDAAVAARLHAELTAHPSGLAVFLATTADPGADPCGPLRRSRLVVVLVSAREDAGFYARADVVEAIGLGRHSDGVQRVLPLFLDRKPGSGTAVPAGLATLHGLCMAEVGLSGAAAQLAMLALKLRGPRVPAPA